jgi:large subunit ribosomal protein L21
MKRLGNPGWLQIYWIEVKSFIIYKTAFLELFATLDLNLTFAVLIFEQMFAIVKIAGQQFRVEKDQTLCVPHVGGNTGDKLEFSDVLLADADGKLSVGDAVKLKIQAEIVDHVKGDKVIAYKQKRRKGFRKKHGHRTHYTKIKINHII